MTILENQSFDAERALYGSDDIVVKNCRFDGPADGESALKESRNVQVEHCFMNLRYPFWHDEKLIIHDSELTPLCRAALWYSHHIEISDTKLHGIWLVGRRHPYGGLHCKERVLSTAGAEYRFCPGKLPGEILFPIY